MRSQNAVLKAAYKELCGVRQSAFVRRGTLL